MIQDRDYAYQFHKVTVEKGTDGVLLQAVIYRFKTVSNRTYIVRLEEYDMNLFAIKFYPNDQKNSTKRYQMLTYQNDARRIFNTCINVGFALLRENESASLIFRGEPQKDEALSETQRYRVYRMFAFYLFNPENFYHHYDDKNSLYLLLNKKNTDPDARAKIENKINDIYVIDEPCAFATMVA